MLEAMYGDLASSVEVRKHLNRKIRLRKANDTLAVYRQFAAKKMPGFTEGRINSQRQKVDRLEALYSASCKKALGQYKTLESLAAIEKEAQAGGGFKARYPVEMQLLAFYKAGQKYQPMLLAMARNIKPSFTESDMSEWKKQYGITDLKKGKAGAPAKHPTLAEQIDKLRIDCFDSVKGKAAKKELPKLLKKALQQKDEEWLKVQAKIPLAERLAQIERDWKTHCAQRAGAKP
jgi:hypothetical protein